MKGEIIYKVLGFLENCALDQIDFISASLESGYGASMGKLNKKLESKKHSREAEKIKKQKIRDFQKYFSKLKKDGLISVNANEKVSLSEKGKKKLNSLRKNSLSWQNVYKKEAGDRVIIISYDIPVVFNRARDVIRNMLNRLGFNMIHKSVWVGKVKLPKTFLEDVDKLEILKFVEILEVTKSGSLKLHN